ncbi:MAG TPA: class I tRNA ligase family protein [Mycobacteriales bacterium]|nr:class I tRNA ligase family protein [Mycobacteriales bacterium]
MGGENPRPLTLVTATAPTPNGPLHVGHLSGPYIAADIAARAARTRGERVLTLSGVDPNQNYVLAKSRLLGEPADRVVGHYEDLVRRAFDLARVEYDVFVDPRADQPYRWAVRDLVGELVETKAATVREVRLARCEPCGRTLHHAYVTGTCPVCGSGSGGGTCEGCGAFTTGTSLVDARCADCGTAPTEATVEIPVLRLEDYRDHLCEVWSTASLPARVRWLIGRYLADGLPDVPLAYPTDWGIPGPALGGPDGDRWADQRVDVWVEMGLGYLYALARHLDPNVRGAEAVVRAWSDVDRVWHFLGIDNAFYFAVLFPALYAAAGVPGGRLGGLVVNEFYRLDGLKFSTSRDHAIWAHEFFGDEDPDMVRLYLCWDRPDHYESDFTREGYLAFRDWVRALRDGGPAGSGPSGLPAVSAAQNVLRASESLRLAAFDPAGAVRCLLPALAAAPDQAAGVLALLTGQAGGRESGGVAGARS